MFFLSFQYWQRNSVLIAKKSTQMIKSLQEVLLLQQNINKKLIELADSNSKLLKEVRLSSRQIQYP